jgi:hypothetical protein
MNHTNPNSFNPFVFKNYPARRPFSSFLPGVAGPLGIPLWVFYVNRGQAVTSFGIESKNNPIMEFQPANRAFRQTAQTGFRTFLKVLRQGTSTFYEPFSHASGSQPDMKIGTGEIILEETAPALDIHTEVTYFTLPQAPFAALVRQVRITNTGPLPLTLEALDGMPALIPYGTNNWELKEIGRTIEAWMEVFNHEARVPYYRLRASALDTAEISEIQAGHFALGVAHEADKSRLLPVFVDPAVLFGFDTAFTTPEAFKAHHLDDLAARPQITLGKTPCAFFGIQSEIGPGESIEWNAMFGHAGDLDIITTALPDVLSTGYFEQKRNENLALCEELTAPVATASGSGLFDAYTQQTFFDNILRGGWPILLGGAENPHVYSIYSRKHGDPERDYNHFFLAAEYFSQGNGNYRDVNQNRRCDVLLNPAVGTETIRTFMSLVQIDGYNPLVVEGKSFTLAEKYHPSVLEHVGRPDELAKLLQAPFTPGGLLRTLSDHQNPLNLPAEEFIDRVLENAEAHLEAVFGEGFWVDHWTYNLDLIENYLAVFPEQSEELLFGLGGLPFFDSPVSVKPRSQKYVLTERGPRQYNAIWEDHEKAELIASRPEKRNWLRARQGTGEITTANLMAKLILLILLKFTTLDPEGMGIEMEAGRPGWYDALNGLPGLFGSSMPETYELLRLIRFIQEQLPGITADREVSLPVETLGLLQNVIEELSSYHESSAENRDYVYWDQVTSAREAYRDQVRLGIDGARGSISLPELSRILEQFAGKLEDGIHRAETFGRAGVPPTYFRYQADGHQPLRAENGSEMRDSQGRPFVSITAWTPVPLPLFLEGPVRALKIKSREEANQLHEAVRASPLYDQPLKMYRVNASLEKEGHEIGRARAFPPGWLENESIWLHMEYKYILEILKAGLYDAFYEDLRNVHGTGFVARLSGSTAEFLSIWFFMMAGSQPFSYRQHRLYLELQPLLPGWFFDESGKVSFKFLGHTQVTYHNLQKQDTWELVPGRYHLETREGESIEKSGPALAGELAEKVRSGEIIRIDVFLEASGDVPDPA